MTSVLPAKNFLIGLNDLLCLEGESIREVKSEEREGQTTLSIVPVHQFVFRKPIDLVIRTECAHSVCEKSTDQFPLGSANWISGEGPTKEPRSWLHYILETENAKHVLIYPECCGPFDPNFVGRLKSSCPGVVWYAPDVGDLYGAYQMTAWSWTMLTQTLLKEEILGAG